MFTARNGVTRYNGILLLSLAIIFVIIAAALFNYFPKGYITNPKRYEGFGAQYQTIIYACIYAELHNLQFVYTPFESMEHNYDNESDFLQNKETLINFVNNFASAKDYRNVRRLDFATYTAFFEQNLSVAAQSKSLTRIKELFRANKPNNFFNNDKLNIAVHIRRPNAHDIRSIGADVPDSDFLRIIAALRTEYAASDYLIHIYSQGAHENFQLYQGDKIVLHLNESIEDTFTGMALADVLVLSPSSFSYTAGLISNGKVYYMPFWHPPLPFWHTLKI